MGRLSIPVNWEQAVKNFIGSYPLDGVRGVKPETNFAHAVQKDAIQNSLDAIDEGNPKKFRVEFKIDDVKDPNYISITDVGTTGLTGRPSLTRSELGRLRPSEYEKERWSRFQSYGYSHPEDAPFRGARGQGKFIFVGSSESKELIFDTLRNDVYRIGQLDLTENKPVMEPLEEEEAEEFVSEHGLEPLDEIGTRVIIPNPKPELYRAFWYLDSEGGCDLERYISSTWWEALKNGRSITINVEDEKSVPVEPPKLYEYFEEDPHHFKYFEPIPRSVGKPFQDDFPGTIVDELVLVYSAEPVPKEIRGIALQRGEMTVERFEPNLPRYNDRIFGWVVMNQKGDMELKKTENAQHYHFNQNRGSLAIELFGSAGWLPAKIEEFGEQIGIITRGRDITDIHSKSMRFLNTFARDLGYDKEAFVGGKRSKKPGGPRGPTEKRLKPQLRMDYPSKNSRKVEFGESVEDIRARVANYADFPQEYELKVTLNRKKGFRRENEEELLVLVEESNEIDSGEKSPWTGTPRIKFTKDYRPGTYVVMAVSQRPDGTMQKETRKMIYLNTRPPLRWGIFRELEVKSFDLPDNKLMYKKRVHEDKKMTLYLNDNHPLFEYYSDEKGEPEGIYVDMCGLNCLLDYDLGSKGLLAKNQGWDNIRELKKKHPGGFNRSLNNISKARQEVLFEGFRRR